MRTLPTVSMLIPQGSNFTDWELNEQNKWIERHLLKRVPQAILKSGKWVVWFVADGKDGYFFIKDNGVIVASLFTAQSAYNPGYQETYSVGVVKSYRGNSLGYMLYVAAILRYKKICSSETLGAGSLIIWWRLAQKYDVRLREDLADVPGKAINRPVDFTWVGKMPVVNGVPIDKSADDVQYFFTIG